MGRWADLDDDEHRLPAGMERIGYDADTETYTFRDASTGRIYESAPGNRYGALRPISSPSLPQSSASPTSLPLPERSLAEDMDIAAHNRAIKQGNRQAARTMLPFALLVLVFLLLLFRFLDRGTGPVTDEAASQVQIKCAAETGARGVRIQAGDSCWAIAQRYGVGVEELLAEEGNEGIECERLQVGRWVCVPAPLVG